MQAGFPGNFTYVDPAQTNHSQHMHSSEPGRDFGPHAVFLGENVRPQKWTIRMTSDKGDYEVVGRPARHDGAGHNQKPQELEN